MKPKVKVFIIILLLINSISAIVAGYLFMTDPSGGKMGMTTETLKHSPFDNYFIPGMVLILANGILSLLVIAMLLSKSKKGLLGLFVQGLILLGWIIIQIFMLREFNLLHVTMISFALIFLYFGKEFRTLKR